MQNTEEIWRLVDAKKAEHSRRCPTASGTCRNSAYTETRSCAEHTAMLREQGFRVTEKVADIPTAVMGEAGEGGPVIAILGEYDALPGLSPGSRRRRAAAAARPRLRPWLRPQPAGLGGDARGDRGEGLPGRPTTCPAASATTAARPRRAAPPRASWCATAPSATSTSPSPGTPPPSPRCRRRCRWPIPASISASSAAPAMPPRRRISAAARWMRSS